MPGQRQRRSRRGESPGHAEEIASTILHLTGISPQAEFIKKDERPIPYVERAKPVAELLA
jgi:hypothetical protein